MLISPPAISPRQQLPELSKRRFRLLLLGGVACFSLLAIAGCGSDSNSSAEGSARPGQTNEAGYTKRVTDLDIPAHELEPGEFMERAWWLWGENDEEAFMNLLSDDLVWASIPAPQSLENMANAYRYQDALNTDFIDVDCEATGETHARTGGVEVECHGFRIGDLSRAFGTDPVPATGRYVIKDGLMVEHLSYSDEAPPFFDFLNEYLSEHETPELAESCSNPDKPAECGRLTVELGRQAAPEWNPDE